MPAPSKIITLLLAAGESARMGRPKQLLTYKNKTLLQHAAETALSVTPVTIVLGANHEAHLNAIKQLPAEHIINRNWKSGMGSSLKAGLTHCIENNPQLEAVIDHGLRSAPYHPSAPRRHHNTTSYHKQEYHSHRIYGDTRCTGTLQKRYFSTTSHPRRFTWRKENHNSKS